MLNRASLLAVATVVISILFTGCSGSDNRNADDPPDPPPGPAVTTCVNGDAGGFACSGIDLNARLPLSAMQLGTPTSTQSKLASG